MNVFRAGGVVHMTAACPVDGCSGWFGGRGYAQLVRQYHTHLRQEHPDRWLRA